MKSRIAACSMLLLSFVLFSCSKPADEKTSNASGCKPESLTEWYNGAVTRAYFYTYDNNGRVGRVDFDSKTSGNYETYT